MDVVLAVDIGASKFACGVVDADGELLVRDHVDVRTLSQGEELWQALAALVSDVAARARQSGLSLVGCGVGSAGPITASCATVSPVNLTGWRDFPLAERLSQHTALTVWGDLDTKALALGEGWVGSGAGVANYLAMVVSTGIGGGLVLDGRLLDGETGNAGHIGHMVVVPGGAPCGCGAQGCLEAEASGRAIEAATGRPASEANPAMVERTGRLVGRAVASVVNLLDLELVLAAGSVALGFGEPFFTAAQAELDANCRLAGRSRPRIVPAGLADRAPLIGAGAVAWRGLRHQGGLQR